MLTMTLSQTTSGRASIRPSGRSKKRRPSAVNTTRKNWAIYAESSTSNWRDSGLSYERIPSDVMRSVGYVKSCSVALPFKNLGNRLRIQRLRFNVSETSKVGSSRETNACRRGPQHQAIDSSIHILFTAHLRHICLRHDQHAYGAALLDVRYRHSNRLCPILRPHRIPQHHPRDALLEESYSRDFHCTGSNFQMACELRWKIETYEKGAERG